MSPGVSAGSRTTLSFLLPEVNTTSFLGGGKQKRPLGHASAMMFCVGLWAEGTGFGLSLVWGFVLVKVSGDEADNKIFAAGQ